MYKKVPIKQDTQTAQKTIWNEFKQPLIIREFASITCIDFTKNQFCFANSTRVQLYNGTNLKKTFSRFSDTVLSCAIRMDEKVVVAGDQVGLVQLFDVQSRAILRTFTGHQNAVRAVQFQGLHKVITGSDDNTIKIWDISSQDCVYTLQEHTDYVRSVRVSKETPHLLLSGSYDHTVKLWDTRNGDCLMTMDHGSPVEDVLFLKGGGLVVSVGSNKLKIWDILKGGALIHSMSHHSKTITCCVLDPTSQYLVTGGLDHSLKVIEVGTWKVVHIIKYTEAILSLGVGLDVLAVGMQGGLLSIRKRIIKTQQVAQPSIRAGSKDYFYRGGGIAAKVNMINEGDVVIQGKRTKTLQQYDKLLRAFRYGEALDAVIHLKNPIVVSSMLDELVHRDGIRIALSNRDEDTLEPLLQFVIKYISDPRYSARLVDVANIVLDLYAHVLGSSRLVETVELLKLRVFEEIRTQRELTKIIGVLDALFCVSNKV